MIDCGSTTVAANWRPDNAKSPTAMLQERRMYEYNTVRIPFRGPPPTTVQGAPPPPHLLYNPQNSFRRSWGTRRGLLYSGEER